MFLKGPRAKAWAAAIGLVVTSFSAAYADEVLNIDEYGSIITAVVTGALSVYAVYRIPNADE